MIRSIKSGSGLEGGKAADMSLSDTAMPLWDDDMLSTHLDCSKPVGSASLQDPAVRRKVKQLVQLKSRGESGSSKQSDNRKSAVGDTSKAIGYREVIVHSRTVKLPNTFQVPPIGERSGRRDSDTPQNGHPQPTVTLKPPTHLPDQQNAADQTQCQPTLTGAFGANGSQPNVAGLHRGEVHPSGHFEPVLHFIPGTSFRRRHPGHRRRSYYEELLVT
eukprot:GHVT01069033.1.p1 GENE.GHVT01069033.1~~GHVT01069033.1.p1  ORF type:complete len:217 (+),score=22.95 GHVT01069033.1:3279-3929(+)